MEESTEESNLEGRSFFKSIDLIPGQGHAVSRGGAHADDAVPSLSPKHGKAGVVA